MTTSISSLFHAGLFRKHNCVVSQSKHLTPTTTGVGIFKMWSTIFLPSKLTEILVKYGQIPGYLKSTKLLKYLTSPSIFKIKRR